MTKDTTLFLVSLNGSLLADRAVEVRDVLVSALNRSSNVAVEFTHIEDIDISVIQLFYAANIEASRLKKKFGFYGEIKPAIVKKLKACGFINHEIVSAADLDGTLVSFKQAEGMK